LCRTQLPQRGWDPFFCGKGVAHNHARLAAKGIMHSWQSCTAGNHARLVIMHSWQSCTAGSQGHHAQLLHREPLPRDEGSYATMPGSRSVYHSGLAAGACTTMAWQQEHAPQLPLVRTLPSAAAPGTPFLPKGGRVQHHHRDHLRMKLTHLLLLSLLGLFDGPLQLWPQCGLCLIPCRRRQ